MTTQTSAAPHERVRAASDAYWEWFAPRELDVLGRAWARADRHSTALGRLLGELIVLSGSGELTPEQLAAVVEDALRFDTEGVSA